MEGIEDDHADLFDEFEELSKVVGKHPKFKKLAKEFDDANEMFDIGYEGDDDDQMDSSIEMMKELIAELKELKKGLNENDQRSLKVLLKRYNNLLDNMSVAGLANEMLNFNLMDKKEWQRIEDGEDSDRSTNDMSEELIDYMESNPQKLAKRFKK